MSNLNLTEKRWRSNQLISNISSNAKTYDRRIFYYCELCCNRSFIEGIHLTSIGSLRLTNNSEMSAMSGELPTKVFFFFFFSNCKEFEWMLCAKSVCTTFVFHWLRKLFTNTLFSLPVFRQLQRIRIYRRGLLPLTTDL